MRQFKITRNVWTLHPTIKKLALRCSSCPRVDSVPISTLIFWMWRTEQPRRKTPKRAKSANHVGTGSVASAAEVRAARARARRRPAASPRRDQTLLGVVLARRRRIGGRRRNHQGMKLLCRLSVRKWRSWIQPIRWQHPKWMCQLRLRPFRRRSTLLLNIQQPLFSPILFHLLSLVFIFQLFFSVCKQLYPILIQIEVLKTILKFEKLILRILKNSWMLFIAVWSLTKRLKIMVDHLKFKNFLKPLLFFNRFSNIPTVLRLFLVFVSEIPIDYLFIHSWRQLQCWKVIWNYLKTYELSSLIRSQWWQSSTSSGLCRLLDVIID